MDIELLGTWRKAEDIGTYPRSEPWRTPPRAGTEASRTCPWWWKHVARRTNRPITQPPLRTGFCVVAARSAEGPCFSPTQKLPITTSPDTVILAKAGIQIFFAREPTSSRRSPCSATWTPLSLRTEKCTPCLLRSRILVSRFRGNDTDWGWLVPFGTSSPGNSGTRLRAFVRRLGL